ncbi:hypothetical protein SAMN04487831_12210 [Pseudobutyrivibrio sp. UC1225]|uniref:hypothetical protein n=1 Tax=Pseudobutyrivibrio sp. UC1225 TaxID=1798185 RepID=UPI0008E75C74|nr:hypothetical protein [Pseudobutyrivibrio sp. UC1225]SFO34024.1 hypothetical protein SAMN04487831_12210 [Pseudobutyrivibrio sp. UC1225]
MGENRRKHIEFVQNNIIRMNQLSFQIKEMSVAILTALLGVYAALPNDDGSRNNLYIYIAIVPLLIFWLLDAYYLQQERKFRGIYNDIRKGKDTDIEVYDMPLARYNGKEYSFINAAFSKTEIPYLVIIIMLILGTFYL